jgi:hypothetical protein
MLPKMLNISNLHSQPSNMAKYFELLQNHVRELRQLLNTDS